MCRLTLFALIVPAALSLAAEPAPNALSADEQAAGWLLLFDGSTTFGWKSEGEISLKDGMLVIGGAKPASATTTSAFGDCELRFQYRLVGAKRGAEARVKGPSGGLPSNRDESIWIDAIVKVENGKLQRAFPSKHITTVLWLNDSGDAKMVCPIAFITGADSTLELRNVKFKPLGLAPIFNGKNLDGWKVFAGDAKRNKSKFTVTKEGWLNVENGPGDLQTTGQWADFLLQLDCISNGDHLNSGIFFRCIPGEYQQGYEAQIRNQWQGDDRTKPVDFGTGAIYRRQSARKVVSTDREWFTLTVSAHANHLATWVNGYQVADFTDTREKNDNARNGSKTGSGAISIQGHDPTTNLSFRNLKIADLKR